MTKRVLVTGSADGLGLMACELLLEQGHEVTAHARSEGRADDTRRALPRAEAVVVGDLSTLAGMKAVADQANALGRYDAVIHNAGIGYRERDRVLTEDGVEHVFATNVLAPYVLTALTTRPDRLVYLTSGMARGGDPDLSDLTWERRRWQGSQAYSDSKLFDILLAYGVARRWPDVRSNAVTPGWVATRMGGRGAPDDLSEGAVTQVWLAVSDDAPAEVTGGSWYHGQPWDPGPTPTSAELQDALLDACAELSGVTLPD